MGVIGANHPVCPSRCHPARPDAGDFRLADLIHSGIWVDHWIGQDTCYFRLRHGGQQGLQMSQGVPWNKSVMAASLLGVSFFMPSEVQAEKVKIVSGLVGGQDAKSKEWLALPQTEADQIATQHLLSVLKPEGKFAQDNSRNVEGMTFVTQPYATPYRYVCRQDRVTLRYESQS